MNLCATRSHACAPRRTPVRLRCSTCLGPLATVPSHLLSPPNTSQFNRTALAAVAGGPVQPSEPSGDSRDPDLPGQFDTQRQARRDARGRPVNHLHRLDRSVFTDEQLFELEMKYIFEGNWVYLAHESQIPNVNDYLTVYIGRQPVVITRSKDGKLNALANTCTHRGAILCRHKKGNKSSFTCPFHGWTFSNSGKLLKVKDNNAEAGYPPSFNCEGSHDMKRLGAFQSYRGFLFGSVNPDVVPLEEHLGEAAKIIDMIVDQSPEGIEVLRGTSTYTFDGNWKLTAENGADGYHVSSVHWNYAATTSRRSADGKVDNVKAMNAGEWAKQGGGSYSFKNGHLLLWTNWSNPEDRPLFVQARRMGREVRRGARRLDAGQVAQPVPVPERLPDGPVQLADPRRAADLGEQERGDDLLHRAQGRGARVAPAPAAPVRGLLQRHRHGHARRPGGVPLLPARLRGAGGEVERHEPRRDALDQGAGRDRRPDRPEARDELHQDRGRRPVHRPARVLAADDEEGLRGRAHSDGDEGVDHAELRSHPGLSLRRSALARREPLDRLARRSMPTTSSSTCPRGTTTTSSRPTRTTRSR